MLTAVLLSLDMTHLTIRSVTTTTVGVHEPSISSVIVNDHVLCCVNFTRNEDGGSNQQVIGIDYIDFCVITDRVKTRQ